MMLLLSPSTTLFTLFLILAVVLVIVLFDANGEPRE